MKFLINNVEYELPDTAKFKLTYHRKSGPLAPFFELVVEIGDWYCAIRRTGEFKDSMFESVFHSYERYKNQLKAA